MATKYYRLDYLDETFRKVTGFTAVNETVLIIE
jgi:hypothetical protein